MELDEYQELARRTMMRRSPLLLIVVAAVLLAACGAPAPASREAELGATIAAPEATIATDTAQATDQPAEAATADSSLPVATPVPEPTNASLAEENPGAVTPIMQELAVAGEPFATEGDPNAPLTIIEFSDYG